MAFMWVRVVTKKTSPAAGAPVVDEAAANEESDSQPRVSFIELPRIAGRNDVITRDFFAANGWKKFDRDKEANTIGTEEVNDLKTDGSEKVVERVTAKLKLGVIETGLSPYVYINDELLSIGDRLRVRDNGNTYDCEVTKIGANEVSLKLRRHRNSLETYAGGPAAGLSPGLSLVRKGCATKSALRPVIYRKMSFFEG